MTIDNGWFLLCIIITEILTVFNFIMIWVIMNYIDKYCIKIEKEIN